MKKLIIGLVAGLGFVGGPVTLASTWIANSPNQINITEGQSEYIVVEGDTLWAIGVKAGVSAGTLANLSYVPNPNLIYPGNVIKLIGKEKVVIETTDGEVLANVEVVPGPPVEENIEVVKPEVTQAEKVVPPVTEPEVVEPVVVAPPYRDEDGNWTAEVQKAALDTILANHPDLSKDGVFFIFGGGGDLVSIEIREYSENGDHSNLINVFLYNPLDGNLVSIGN